MSLNKFFELFPGYAVTSAQLVFARYLESRGRRLLVDFGFENAEDLAWHDLEQRYPMRLQ